MYGRRSGFRAPIQARIVDGSAGRGSDVGARAAAMVSPSGKRLAGSRWRQRSIAAANAGGTPGATRMTLGGASVA